MNCPALAYQAVVTLFSKMDRTFDKLWLFDFRIIQNMLIIYILRTIGSDSDTYVFFLLSIAEKEIILG